MIVSDKLVFKMYPLRRSDSRNRGSNHDRSDRILSVLDDPKVNYPCSGFDLKLS